MRAPPDGAGDLEQGGGGNTGVRGDTSGVASLEEGSGRGTKGKAIAAGTTGIGSTGGGGESACGCVRSRITWAIDGGLLPSRETSALESCATFTHERSKTGQRPLTCRQALDSCSSDVAALTALLLRPDILMARTLAPVLYGEDPRPADGQLLRIDMGGAVIEVGEPCQSSACKPIPDGIATLGAALRALSKRELARDSCREVFKP